MYDSDDHFSNDINSEYWDDVYYDETHTEYDMCSGPRYGGGTSKRGISPLMCAFIVGIIFSAISPNICGEAFIVTWVIMALAKKYG